MFPPDIFRKLCRLSEDVDWSDTAFDLQKACYCSLFAQAVYNDLPEFELKKAKRIAVVPCGSYLEQLAVGDAVFLERYLNEADIGPFVVIRSPFAIIARVSLPHVVIVAIRGTQNLFDLYVDLDFRARRLCANNVKAMFHRGFLFAAAWSAQRLYADLTDYAGDVPLYVTGHSLGGAIAAVYNAVFPYCNTAYKPMRFHYETTIEPRSCYTFGMPRYGFKAALENFPAPYHVFHSGDMVPTLPPEGLFYEKCPVEYQISEAGLETVTVRPPEPHWAPAQIVAQFRSGIANHSIEQYVDFLFKAYTHSEEE
jgi:Lipase (class 3)